MADRGHRLECSGIVHRFGDFLAVDDVSVTVEAGEMLALLGPSGCGKSTLLRIIAGFIRQTQGQVTFDRRSVDHLDPRRRGVGIVFQNYALFPHMSVRQNVAYGLEAQRRPRHEIALRVDEMLALVHMSHLADRLPRQLSGGQQQRIALARCLAVDPKILLLDEPFGALDKNLRLDMQIEVKRLQREYGITTVLVTHDQEEALSMADHIAVMNKGRIEQVASPIEIYDEPRTPFVNGFVGSTNIVAATVLQSTAAGTKLRIAGVEIDSLAPGPFVTGATVNVSIRPERFLLDETGPGLPGRINTVLPMGAQVAYDVELNSGEALKIIRPRDPSIPLMPPGSSVVARPTSPDAVKIFA